LLAAVDDPDEDVRVHARAAFSALGLEAEGVEGLLKVLEDPRAAHRVRAADFLAAGGKEAVPALPRLQKLLKDADPKVRAAVERAVKQMGHNPGDQGGRFAPPGAAALAVLVLLVPATAEQEGIPERDVPALIRMLKAEDARVRGEAAQALAALKPEAA